MFCPLDDMSHGGHVPEQCAPTPPSSSALRAWQRNNDPSLPLAVTLHSVPAARDQGARLFDCLAAPNAHLFECLTMANGRLFDCLAAPNAHLFECLTMANGRLFDCLAALNACLFDCLTTANVRLFDCLTMPNAGFFIVSTHQMRAFLIFSPCYMYLKTSREGTIHTGTHCPWFIHPREEEFQK
jgi:hypothetical protein